MADVRNKFFVVDNYTEGDNIFFLYSCSVFSESRCRYILIMPHKLREFANSIVHEKKSPTDSVGIFPGHPFSLNAFVKKQLTVEVFTAIAL